MSPLWRWISFRHLWGERGRSLLLLFGVALGVAVYVAIRLANSSALASFSDTIDAVTGKANLQVMGDSTGFDERVFPRIKAVPGVQAAAPVVEVYSLAPTLGDETLMVLGIDMFSERPFNRFLPPAQRGTRATGLAFLADRRAVAITKSLAGRHRLKVGDSIPLIVSSRTERVTVRLILDSEELQQAMGGNVAVMDIATAQEVFQRFGRIDRIDMIVDESRRDAVTAAIQPLLPGNTAVGMSSSRTQQVENLVAAFSLNLTALSFIAVFVGMFLIFNSISTAVLRRRREIGILRSLGVTRAQITRQFLGEALAIGAVGSLIGLGLGTLMAQGALKAVSRTLTELYLVVAADSLSYDPWVYLQGLGIGLLTALAAGLAPAIEASRTPPSVTMRQGILIEAQPLRIGWWSAGGAALLALAAAIAVATVARHRPEGGFASAFLVLGGFSLLAPGATRVGARLLAPVMRALFGTPGTLGARYVSDSLARTSVIIAALMVAVGMMVALDIMVGSFRRTVDIWVQQTLKGDLYVQPVDRRVTGNATALPPDVVRKAYDLEGVAAVDTYRSVRTTYGGKASFVVAVDLGVLSEHGRFRFMEGESREVLRETVRQEGVVITESFNFRHGVGVGDHVRLQTPSGLVSLPVLGVFYDYSTDAGAILMDQSLFSRLWQDTRVERLAFYLKPGVDARQVKQAYEQSLGERNGTMIIQLNQELRNRVLEVFDQTFQITYALQAITVLVAILGVVSTLTALILQRGREIGVLRAVGALRSQVRRMVLVESSVIGLLGALLGCVCGTVLSLLLVFVINKQFFGWSIQLYLNPLAYVNAVVLLFVAALIAGIGPARLAAGRLAAEAMRVE